MIPVRERFAKIIATLGPASATLEQSQALVAAGVDAFRVNLSYDTPEGQAEHIARVRALEAESGVPLSLVVDLEGPRFRIGTFAEGKVELEQGATFRLDQSQAPGDAERVCMPHPEVYAHIRVGQTLVLDDGRIRLKVKDTSLFRIDTEVEAGGTLASRKVISLGDIKPQRDKISAEDLAALDRVLELGVDWVTLSWPGKSEAFTALKARVAGRARLLVKVDSEVALGALDTLIAAADGLVIARGDLGYDLPAELLPGWQKDITMRCRRAGKPVIIAAQMLDSMVSAPAPTRAEASDVANAVFDGADAVMLSAETAVGDYPVEAVRIMDRIIREIEEEGAYWPLPPTEREAGTPSIAKAIATSAAQVAQSLEAAAIICHTSSGSTPLAVASLRSQTPIISFSDSRATTRQMNLVWGLTCVYQDQLRRWRDIVESSLNIANQLELGARGQTIVITAGMPFGTSGTTNIMRVARIDEPPPPQDA